MCICINSISSGTLENLNIAVVYINSLWLWFPAQDLFKSNPVKTSYTERRVTSEVLLLDEELLAVNGY